MKHAGVGLLLALSIGCAVEEIPFATERVEEPDAGVAAPSERACSDTEPCEAGQYCDLLGCDSTRGTCRESVSRASCGSALEPVCGCDGATYFNDCLRQAGQVAAATSGPCLRDGQRCGVTESEPCQPGFVCAKLFPLAVGAGLFPSAVCLPQLPGICWMAPDTCDPQPGEDDWVSCEDGASARCVDTCTAIKSERLHVPTSTCTP